jgi:DNA-binding response OmpR family regulator
LCELHRVTAGAQIAPELLAEQNLDVGFVIDHQNSMFTPKAKALRLDVPIIMITAYGDAETKRKALECGAEALLTKPIDFGTLRSEIDMRVERAR